ncbi:MAG: hypothetical protein EZS28_032077, partial [Streblomastix strix]
SRNNKQRQRNKSFLLRATPFRASLQDVARSGNLDTFRQHNSNLRYWEIESEGISDRKNKTVILPSEKTLTTNHNNPHSRKTELNDRFTLETMQIGGLHTEEQIDLNGLQDMKLYSTDRHIRNTIQQTNQELCYSGSHRSEGALPQRIIRQNSGDGTENEGQGSKTSSRQCGCLPSGPVVDAGRDLLLRCMKMRGFSEEVVNLLFR